MAQVVPILNYGLKILKIASRDALGRYFGYPQHLLRQNFPSEGKLGEFSLRGKIIPLSGKFFP